MCVCIFAKSELFSTELYCHLWPFWLYHIFPHYSMKDTIFLKYLLNINCVFWFCLLLLPELFLVLRREQWDVIINICRSSYKVPVTFVRFEWEFSWQILENPKISNFIKICPVGAELFHMGRWIHSHDNSNSQFSHFCKCT